MNSSMKTLVLFAAIASALLTAHPALATLNIQVLDATIPNNGTGFVDVVISGNNDNLQGFDFEFMISAIGPVTSSLQFTDPQSDPQLNDLAFIPNYVFSGDSTNVNLALPMGSVNLAQDTFTGSDSTFSLNDVVVGGTKLLVRLDLGHIVPFGVDASGDQFRVELTNANFLDSGAAAVPFTSTFGTATVAATAVPEPSSMALLSITCAGLAMYRKRRAGWNRR